ncbi:thioredoxin domain-containing protein [Streptomyces sp. NPDC002133]|uniref:thioredoxin domain-containing protein n=1 Tax=Streptomyces sp. NPDC002133 TaxID=3154409 RepID=UPI00332EC927
MSEKNRDGRRAARERLLQERELDKAREKRRRLLIVSAAVVGVLGLAAVIGVIAAGSGGKDDSTEAGPVVAPSGAEGEEQLALPAGASDAPSTLTIWEDFRCPACAQFENGFRDTIHELTDSGQLKVEYHLATIIDANVGGTGSLRAANAAACAQDAGKFVPYHDVLYQNQPPETEDGFADTKKLIELAGKVEGLDTPAFRSCVEEGRHNSWVNKSAQAFREGSFTGTPTVLLNGKPVFPQKDGEQISPENLKKWVTEANAGKQPGTVQPSPAGS